MAKAARDAARRKSKRKRGRKPNPLGKIVSNGLFEHQWEQVQKDGLAQGKDGAAKLREIVDWYYSAKEHEEGTFSLEEKYVELPTVSPVAIENQKSNS